MRQFIRRRFASERDNLMLVARRSRFDALLRLGTFALIAASLTVSFDDRTFALWFFARVFTTLVAGLCIARFQQAPTARRFVAVFLAYVLDALPFFWLVFYFWLSFTPEYQLIAVLMLAAAFIYSLTHRLRVPTLGLIYVVAIQLSFSLFWITLLLGERSPTDVGLAITVMGLQFYHAVTMHETFTTLATIDQDARRGEAARRLEAMGRVAGGVAHEFNNHLATIVSGIDLVRARKSDSDTERHLGLALEAAQKASEDVGRLLAYTHQSPLRPIACDVAEIVDALEDHHRSTYRREVALTSDLAPGMPALRVDKDQLLAALAELLKNAVEAGADHVEVRARASASPAASIIIEVSDDGAGIAPELAERIFDPFFSAPQSTAKPGLGLSMVRGFVEQSGGEIGLHADPARSTTFVLSLPTPSGTPA